MDRYVRIMPKAVSGEAFTRFPTWMGATSK
nr:hypothetical protein [Methylocystis hirsuta]